MILSYLILVSIQKNMKRAHHHVKYNLQYHLVLVTKYRKKCLTPEILNYLNSVFHELCLKWEIELKEFSGEPDHVHLLIDCHPSLEIGKLINNLKTVSSRYTRKHYLEHLNLYLSGGGLWTRAYYISTIGNAPLDVIKTYIENQGK